MEETQLQVAVNETLAGAEAASDTKECPKCLRSLTAEKLIVKRTSGYGCKDSLICKDCKNAFDRIGRLMDLGDELGKLDNLTDESRAAMLVQAHDMSRGKLAKLVHDTLEKYQQTSRTRHFKRHDDFLDEEDLRERLKNKPDQCNAILALAESERCWCRSAKVWLYPVPSYTAEDSVEDRRVEKRGREITTDCPGLRPADAFQ